MSTWEERVTSRAEAEDLDGLDALAAEELTDEQKHTLAEDGYLMYASTLHYDLACNKAPEHAPETILHCVERASALVGRTLWSDLGNAYVELMRKSDRLAYADKALEAFAQCDAFDRMSWVHYELAAHDDAHQLEHWEHAWAATMRGPIEQRNWYRVVSMLYAPLEREIDAVRARRDEERVRFEALPAFGTYTDVEIARCFDERLPLPPRMTWIERARTWDASNASQEQVRTAAHLLSRYEGPRATELYAQLVTLTAEPRLEVHYLASQLEKDGRIDDALVVYAKHHASFSRDISTMIHYAELLERAVLLGKVPIEQARSIAEAAEVVGRGFYSGPGMVLARLALHEGDDAQARFHLERLLVLHDVSCDRLFEALAPESVEMKTFVDETLRCLADLREHYVVSTRIEWDALKTLPPDEVSQLWRDRQAAPCRKI